MMAEESLTNLVKECIEIAKDKIEKTSNPAMYFHNWDHTLNVFQATTEISSNTEGITERELELMQIAALFHDVTTCEDHKGHEKTSATFASGVLKEKQLPQEEIDFITRLILSTNLKHEPADIYESIIKDADLSHLRKDSYITRPFINLFKEINTLKKLTPQEWINECISFFEENNFFTPYALENFNKGKEKNKARLIELSGMGIENSDELEEQTSKFKKKKANGKAKKNNKTKPDKGVETMFRIELRNHLNLSRIADDKANTLISVNAIIISIVLSTLFPKLDNNPYLTFPALTLVLSSITTIIISIVSTIPRTTHGLLTRDDVTNRRGNLVFFGNFYKMNLDDFEWGIEELLNDKDYLYKTLTRDLYYLGIVLKKKYTFLRVGYITFVTGLIISSIIFVVKIFMNYQYFTTVN